MTTTAELQGSVTADGASTSYYFEYGTSTSYGSKSSSGRVGGAATSTPVSVSVSGLHPATSYVFRLVASNSAGTSYGLPQYLTTAASSCVTDEQTVTSAGQTVQNQQQAISLQRMNIAATEAGQSIDPATLAQDRAAVTQDKLTVAL